MIIKNITARNLFWLLILICVVTILPFLGLSDFHTKGEPREAVVAYSMLEQGNWILPSNNGGDIPYKPPFFHWCIAVASLLNGGVVNEFTSRLPSAIALIAMTLAIFVFYAKRKGDAVAVLTSIVTLTAFEIHRAGPNCRVDMMLTALTVCALLSFYTYYERGLKGVPWIAILLMSLATLTKGPVGAIIPCLCFGVFLLCRRVNFFKAFLLMVACGVASFILPSLWYITAYGQGGEEFLQLVMEENFGRMTGTMTYDVHINPWYYNLITIISGYLPWTLLLLFSLFSFRKLDWGKNCKTGWRKCLIDKYKHIDPVNLFSAICVGIIFLFYCIPSGKRSVYLMPLYPFLSYFISLYIIRLTSLGSRSVKVYGSLLATIGLLIPVIFILIKAGAISDTIFSQGKHAAQNAEMLRELSSVGGFAWVLILLPAAIAIGWFRKIYKEKSHPQNLIWWICGLTFGIYLCVDGAFQPAIFTAKSQRPVAAEIEAVAPESEGVLYEYIAEAEHAAGDPVHFFELDFYLQDRIHNFLKENPSQGFLLLTDEDAKVAIPRFEQDGYQFYAVYESSRQVLFHRPAQVYRFVKTDVSR